MSNFVELDQSLSSQTVEGSEFIESDDDRTRRNMNGGLNKDYVNFIHQLYLGMQGKIGFLHPRGCSKISDRREVEAAWVADPERSKVSILRGLITGPEDGVIAFESTSSTQENYKSDFALPDRSTLQGWKEHIHLVDPTDGEDGIYVRFVDAPLDEGISIGIVTIKKPTSTSTIIARMKSPPGILNEIYNVMSNENPNDMNTLEEVYATEYGEVGRQRFQKIRQKDNLVHLLRGSIWKITQRQELIAMHRPNAIDPVLHVLDALNYLNTFLHAEAALEWVDVLVEMEKIPVGKAFDMMQRVVDHKRDIAHDFAEVGFNVDEELEDYEMSSDLLVEIFEAAHNAGKNGATQVNIYLTSEYIEGVGGNIICEITDNGVGIHNNITNHRFGENAVLPNDPGSHTNFGLTNMKNVVVICHGGRISLDTYRKVPMDIKNPQRDNLEWKIQQYIRIGDTVAATALENDLALLPPRDDGSTFNYGLDVVCDITYEEVETDEGVELVEIVRTSRMVPRRSAINPDKQKVANSGSTIRFVFPISE